MRKFCLLDRNPPQALDDGRPRIPLRELVKGTKWDLPYFCLLLVLFITYVSLHIGISGLLLEGRIYRYPWAFGNHYTMNEESWISSHLRLYRGSDASAKKCGYGRFQRVLKTERGEVFQEISRDEYLAALAGRPLTASEKEEMQTDIERDRREESFRNLVWYLGCWQYPLLPIATVWSIVSFFWRKPWRHNGLPRYVPIAMLILVALNWVYLVHVSSQGW